MPPTLSVTGRVKSVLVIDMGAVPPSVYRSLEQDGWICVHAPDLASARVLLHEVRPALVLAQSTLEACTLRQDPLLAGVPVVVLEEAAGEIDSLGLAARLDALVLAGS